MINGASKEFWKYWVQYTNLCLIEDILIVNTKQNPTLKLFTKCLYHGRERPTCLSCCMTLLAQITLGEHIKRACERLYWACMRRDVRNWIESCDVCLKRKGTKQKHRHPLLKGNLVIHFNKYL